MLPNNCLCGIGKFLVFLGVISTCLAQTPGVVQSNRHRQGNVKPKLENPPLGAVNAGDDLQLKRDPPKVLPNNAASLNAGAGQDLPDPKVQPVDANQNYQKIQPQRVPVQQQKTKLMPVDPGANEIKRMPAAQSRNVGAGASIAMAQECSADIGRICEGRKLANNIDVLTCLNDREFEDEELSEPCHHLVWQYKVNVTTNPKFDAIARQVCKRGLDMFSDCGREQDGSGKLIPCLVEHREQIKVPTCVTFLKKISSIIYSDYRFICDFVSECQADIIKYHCGRVSGDGHLQQDNMHTSQGAVIACLEQQFGNGIKLESKCSKQIQRIAELSADDYNLDRNLYFKCRSERDRLCDHEVAGEGRIYRCLLNHKFNHDMSEDCRVAITTRQKLVSQDYKASYSLQNGCTQEIKQHCPFADHNANDQKDLIGLSTILLCLEQKKLQGVMVSSKCENQLADFRQMMIENYELSAEVTNFCAVEINKKCSGEIEKQETLHCLMGLAEQPPNELNQPALSENCAVAIRHLIKETEVASDYKMDKVLSRACNRVINTMCGDLAEGDPMVLSCLMENLYSPKMPKECEKHLLELQYFISRDFFLDPVFYKKCKKDSKKLCHYEMQAGGGAGGGEDGQDVEETMPFNLILSCLHRHDRGNSEMESKLSEGCQEQVHRVLKDRALDFHLNPELESKCRTTLGRLCSDEVAERGKELICLQDHYENITDQACIKTIQELTNLESEDAGSLENILISACEPMLHKHCKHVLDSEDEGKVMNCLIEHKNDMENEKCAAGILHFQLIEMKDYHFSYQFLKACKADVEQYCTAPAPKSKADVILCLSKNVRDIKLVGGPHKVSEKCRAQLTVENLQMKIEKHENIKLNPDVHKSCQKDFQRLCRDVKPGKAHVLECLRQHSADLSNECRRNIYTLKKEEAVDENLDFNLMRACKKGIKNYCMAHLESGEIKNLMDCLIQNKPKLDSTCKSILFKREKEMFNDIDLNPILQKACEHDIKKFCAVEINKAKIDHEQGVDPHGVIYGCLKERLAKADRKKTLSQSCAQHVVEALAEEEKDYRLDPALTLHCLQVIKTFCNNEEPGMVVECLKTAFIDNKVQEHQCAMEIATLIDAGRSDVQADPVLNQACGNDIEMHCRMIVPGNGRVITCLINHQEILNPECRDELESRQKMWKAHGNVEGLSDLSRKVMESENSSYILTLLTLMFIGVLLMGTLCGRFTKRVVRDRKNR
uniref:Golgi apparatus protein 1 n=1 Tax=Phallusia mammillata TaxID=59560 RepID=A0A6F9DEI4_9ASCI|nr:Golgi apparatus protein 1 [Phallusia mammillata]